MGQERDPIHHRVINSSAILCHIFIKRNWANPINTSRKSSFDGRSVLSDMLDEDGVHRYHGVEQAGRHSTLPFLGAILHHREKESDRWITHGHSLLTQTQWQWQWQWQLQWQRQETQVRRKRERATGPATRPGTVGGDGRPREGM